MSQVIVRCSLVSVSYCASYAKGKKRNMCVCSFANEYINAAPRMIVFRSWTLVENQSLSWVEGRRYTTVVRRTLLCTPYCVSVGGVSCTLLCARRIPFLLPETLLSQGFFALLFRGVNLAFEKMVLDCVHMMHARPLAPHSSTKCARSLCTGKDRLPALSAYVSRYAKGVAP